MVPPRGGTTNTTRDGRSEVVAAHSTDEVGTVAPSDPAEGRSCRVTELLERKMEETPSSQTVSTKLERIAKQARALSCTRYSMCGLRSKPSHGSEERRTWCGLPMIWSLCLRGRMMRVVCWRCCPSDWGSTGCECIPTKRALCDLSGRPDARNPNAELVQGHLTSWASPITGRC